MTTDADLLDLAVRAGTAAAAFVTERRRGHLEVTSKTTVTDVVTDADKGSEDLIRSLILGERPEDGFLGEEGNDITSRSGVRWIVDPIDGTVNFLYGLEQYAVSIAAERDGVVVAGVVVDVTRGRRFTAVLGDDGVIDARVDGAPLVVRGPAPLGERLIGTGFSYAASTRAIQAGGVSYVLPRVRDIRRMGSCALDLCAVAEGRLDGYYEEGPHPWDWAAGSLIARGAGASFEVSTGTAGGALLVCAPSHGYQEFRALLVEAGVFA